MAEIDVNGTLYRQEDPIVSMVEFQGRLWVATTNGVFVKRRNEDVFDPVEMIPAPEDKPSGFGCDI